MIQAISSYLNAIQLTAGEKALRHTFNTADVTGVSILAGGLSNAPVLKIVVHGHPYVLKLDSPYPNAFGQLQLASDAGIAPPLYYHDAATGISISKFIDAHPIRNALTSDKLIPPLSQAIKTIHRVQRPTGGADLKGIIEGLITGFSRKAMITGPVIDECFDRYQSIRVAYPWYDEDKVFSHNDLNPNNILFDGARIWIIDWDRAFANDRYVDLAAVANFFIRSPQEEINFLEVYFETSVDAYQLARFYVMRQVSRIIYAMLMFQAASRHRPADHQHDQEMEGIDLTAFGALMSTGRLSLSTYEGQLMYGKALLNEAVQQMRTERFADSIDVIEK